MINIIDVSIIIPVYNNSETISIINSQINNELSRSHLFYEIIFVNDASTDKSLDEITALQSKFRNIKLINNEHNIGQQRSLLEGIFQSCGKYCVVMDADLQDSPKYILPLIEALKPPFEAVFAIRQGFYESMMRMLSSYIFKSFTQALSGLHRKAGTFFVIKSDLISELGRFQCRWVYITFMIACLLPGKIQYIKVVRKMRNSKKSGYYGLKRIKASLRGIACIIECRYKIAFDLVRK